LPQIAFHIVLQPDKGEEYVRLHSPVPDAISEQLAQAGISDFSIFLDREDVFGVFEYESEEKLARYLADDVSPDWTQAIIRICLRREIDPELPTLKRLPRVFRFDKQGS